MPLDNSARPLSTASRDRVDPAVPFPGYDREALRPAIVHLAVGSFHRAHLATYVHELCQAGNLDWAIVGAGVLPGDAEIADALRRQDHLYTLIVRGPDETTVEVIGSIVDYHHAHPDSSELIARLAERSTEIVSMTITEGGYPVDDETGRYQPSSPNSGSGSAFAILAAAMERRRSTHGAPLTVLSCDNILSNGDVARTALLGEAERVDPALASWIEATCTFPNSMVDRITPATTSADRAWLADNYGIDDLWPVVTEPFRQWVIEDRFAGSRPPLEELDVILTDDVAPYELMKLRLLNASHSCLAYLAAIAGFEHVHTAMADPHLRRFVGAFLDHEAGPTVPTVAGIQIDDYMASLVDRFSNPGVADQVARLCLDGSAKFPKFLLPTIKSQLESGGPVAAGALALAGWCEYLGGSTLDGDAITLAADPLLSTGVEHAARARTSPSAFLAFSEVFSDDVASHPRFVAAFEQALLLLRAEGLASAVEAVLGGPTTQ